MWRSKLFIGVHETSFKFRTNFSSITNILISYFFTYFASWILKDVHITWNDYSRQIMEIIRRFRLYEWSYTAELLLRNVNSEILEGRMNINFILFYFISQVCNWIKFIKMIFDMFWIIYFYNSLLFSLILRIIIIRWVYVESILFTIHLFYFFLIYHIDHGRAISI